MIHPDLNAWVAVISNNRPQNVSAIQRQLKAPATWYVNNDEKVYKAAGAGATVKTTFPKSRNDAMDDAFKKGVPCVMMDDDFVKAERVFDDKSKRAISLVEAIGTLLDGIRATEFKLAGTAPTANAFYFTPGKPISTNTFIIASLLVILPNKLRFDELLKLKHDYDLTIQHFKEFGGVYRRNDILLTFKHYGNAGGCNDYRTPEVEEADIEILQSKWPENVRRNPKREHEILLQLK